MIKVFELFNKKPKFKKDWSTGSLYNAKGNYLTKQEQPEESFNPYLYNNGFGDRYYKCGKCDSYKLIPIAKGGMQSPEWQCTDCGVITFSPMWFKPSEYRKYIEEKELNNAMKKYNL